MRELIHSRSISWFYLFCRSVSSERKLDNSISVLRDHRERELSFFDHWSEICHDKLWSQGVQMCSVEWVTLYPIIFVFEVAHRVLVKSIYPMIGAIVLWSREANSSSMIEICNQNNFWWCFLSSKLCSNQNSCVDPEFFPKMQSFMLV
jgi:hypothetical protein